MQEKIKILLVDDEEEFVKTLAERIRIRGFLADISFSGEEALSKLKEPMPDVMVLDLKMPGMDGMEVLRQAKKRPSSIPVLILTGHGSEKDKDEALRIGAFAYLQKPVDIEVLIEHVRRAFSGHG
jgi:DNA-binding response OmpR family regulator